MYERNLIGRTFRHARIHSRTALVNAEFPHPVTDAPMVTWYQTNPEMNEEPEFYTWSRKEFREAFPDEVAAP